MKADRVVFAQQQVAGLHVSMQHADFVQGAERRRHLPDIAQRLRRVETLAHARTQVAAGKEFHGQVDMVVRDADVEDPRDVRVPQMRHEFELAQEAFERRAAFDDVRHLAKDLEHALLARAQVFGEEHARGAADGKASQAAVAADAHRAEAIGWILLQRSA